MKLRRVFNWNRLLELIGYVIMGFGFIAAVLTAGTSDYHAMQGVDDTYMFTIKSVVSISLMLLGLYFALVGRRD